MKIKEVQTQLASLPLPGGPWGDTIHHVTHIEIIVTDIVADNGLMGTGFSHTSGVGGTTIRALIERDLAPFIAGKEASPRGLWYPCWKHVHDMGGGGVSTMALAAIDIALWDLQAKESKKSLTALLGQCHDRVPAYASGINLNKTESELLEQVKGWLRSGFQSFKVKVGKPEIEEDVERLTKVRELIGHRQLMVDANQGWDVGKAARAINAYAHLGPVWVEEPLLCDDIDGHARLRQLVRTPIAIGENVYTLQQFNQYLSRGACDFVQADIVRVGGITPYLEVAALARAWNVPLAPHFMMELTGQVLCCLPNAYILESIDGGSLTDLRALKKPIRIVDGYLTPPAEVIGHGIEFDRAYLHSHAVA